MNGELIPRKHVSLRDRNAMFVMLDRHFENVTREQFEADLDEKNWVIMLRDSHNRLCGFTTLRLDAHESPSGTCHVISSGDTIVEPHAWGSSALLRVWLHGVLSLRDRVTGNHPLYWLLITSGFRTYRFMPLFWQTFFPRFDKPTPRSIQRQINLFARSRYDEAYDEASGIVRLARPQRLRSHLAGIPQSRRDDPHIAFFTTRNPGHAAGDELVSLTEIDENNLTRAGQRILRTGCTQIHHASATA